MRILISYFILAVSGILSAAAFKCEFPCPQNALCTAEEICSCVYGYKAIISELDGLPYCQWQGTTTTKRTVELVAPYSLLVENQESVTKASLDGTHLQEDDDLVDDNGELYGDYRYQRDQQLKEFSSQAETAQQFLETLDTKATSIQDKDATTIILSNNSAAFAGIFSTTQTSEPAFTMTEIIMETTAESGWNEKDTSDLKDENQTIYRNKNLANLDMFYNMLALFCMLLAFLFIVSVAYGCVKL